MFGCLRLLQSEQRDWQKSKAFSYCQNAAYIIVLTHIYTYAQAYSYTNEQVMPVSLTISAAVTRIVFGLFYFTESI
jgi:hypothetical protein